MVRRDLRLRPSGQPDTSARVQPQNAIPLFAPLVVLAFSLRLHLRPCVAGYFFQGWLPCWSSATWAAWPILRSHVIGGRDAHKFYATADEMAALDWLDKNLRPGAVVLALPPVASRISKYTSASSLVGHYSVTPKYNSTMARVKRVLAAPRVHALRAAPAAPPGGRLSLRRPAGAAWAWL